MKKKEQTDSMVSHFCTLLHKEVQPMAQKERATVNRNYKDTVFRMLFSDRKNLLSLYNAVNQRKYLHQILLSFIMVRRQLLTVQSFGFPRHLNICQVNQNLN